MMEAAFVEVYDGGDALGVAACRSFQDSKHGDDGESNAAVGYRVDGRSTDRVSIASSYADTHPTIKIEDKNPSFLIMRT